MRAALFLTVALLAGAGTVLADPALPTPESVLGFRPGEDRRLADWDEVLAYLESLDEASDRLSVEEVGRTTQGRPFVLATVTSEATPNGRRTPS